MGSVIIAEPATVYSRNAVDKPEEVRDARHTMFPRLISLISTLLLLTTLVLADEDLVGLEALPDAPPPPLPVVSGEPMDIDLEPEIRIIRRAEDTVEEYRFNGKLYMVKITPKFGRPYFLRDTDGDGKMETRLSSIYSDMVVPQWVLFSWD